MTAAFTPLRKSEVRLAPVETLVLDRRAYLSPADFVEEKLRAVLKGKGAPVSQLILARLHQRRRALNFDA